MNFIKKSALVMCLTFVCLPAFSQDNFVWKNDLRTKFLNNETVIMEVNIRSFNSQDIDGDGFIQQEQGEVRGTFLNAIDRLDELKNLGVNTLHVLPITPTGKRKALGTAGSLYAAADFASINEDLIDKNSDLSAEEQVKEFVKQAHKRGIRLIVDVPACGSYDLYLQRPDLFVSSSAGDPVLPEDWTDVRLLATGTEDKIDTNVYGLYKDFVKYVINLGFDGIRADVAHCKTKAFWKELIEYSRKKDPEFMWLAESSEIWNAPIAQQAVYTPYDELLNAGFDGYYGSFFNLKNWEHAKDLYNNFSAVFSDLKNFTPKKSVIGSFTTHDEVSPILQKGEAFSDMIIWLNATLPLNSYFVDGFQTGDNYNYPMGNKTAPASNTDDDIYFTHRGKIDIFNLSRKPGGNNKELRNDFILANDVKKSVLSTLNNGTFTPLKTNHSTVFAYSFGGDKKAVVTIGNLDFSKDVKAVVKLPKYTKKNELLPIKITDMPKLKHGKIYANLKAGETIVLIFK
jgi:glycosidase